MLLQQLINGIVIGSVYALTAMGASLVYGVLRILDVASACAYAVGAYTAMVAYGATGSFPLALLAGMAVAACLGYVLQRWLYVPLMDRPRLASLIVSIGLLIFFGDFLRLLAGPQVLALNVTGLPGDVRFPGLNLHINGVWLMILATSAVLFGCLWYLLRRTLIGLAWKAAAQDMEMAKAFGIDVHRLVALNFILGYAFAGAAGIMVGVLYNSVFPTMGHVPAYKMLTIIVLGGLGNPVGTVLAAMLIGLAETLVGGYVGFFLPRDAIAFVVLMAVLQWQPHGLLGTATERS